MVTDTAVSVWSLSDFPGSQANTVEASRQALANGLVDEMGTLDEAIADAWKTAGMPVEKEPELLILPRTKSFISHCCV